MIVMFKNICQTDNGKRHFATALSLFIIFASSAVTASAQDDNLAGWHLSYTDSLQGANVKQALDFLKQHNRKQKRKTVTVAVIDSGADTLTCNINQAFWTNPKERPADGIDNDRNGYADDIHGWNFLGTRDGSFNMLSAGTEEYRQFKRLYPKYKDVKSEDEVADKAEYAYYKEMRKKAGINGYLTFYAYSQQKSVAIEMMDSLLQKADIAEADTMKLWHVAGIEMADTLWDGLCQMLAVDILRTEKTATWGDFKKQQADNLALMSRRINGIEHDADKRLLMGDDLENADDRFYGNPTLTIDGCEHGTFVAGVIGGNGGGDKRYAGVADGTARLMILRASPDGDEYDKDVATAIRYAVDNGAKVINISLGKYESPTPQMVNDAIAYAEKKDVLIVQASGNNGRNIDTVAYYPTGVNAKGERFGNLIRVGASDTKGHLASFSNYGESNVDLLAPGESIASAFPTDKFDLQQGTSVAAPVVSGVAALLRAYFPKLKASEIKQILVSTAHPCVDTEKRAAKGCIDMLAAVKKIMKK